MILEVALYYKKVNGIRNLTIQSYTRKKKQGTPLNQRPFAKIHFDCEGIQDGFINIQHLARKPLTHHKQTIHCLLHLFQPYYRLLY